MIESSHHAVIRPCPGRRLRTTTAVLASLGCNLLLVAGLAGASGPSASVEQSGVAGGRRIAVDLRSLPEAARATPGKAVSSSAASRPHPAVPRTSPAAAPDPLVAVQEGAGAAKAASLTAPSFAFDGLAFTGAMPAGVTGDVGSTYYVQAVNGPSGAVFAVYDKATHQRVAGPTELDRLWPADGPCASGWGHPSVLYDRLAGRWLLAEQGAGNHLCVYVSQSGDPVAGGFYAYQFDAPQFPDAPRFAAWSDAYYAASDEEEPALYAFQRSAMLGGDAASYQRVAVPALEGFGFQRLTPAHVEGAQPPPAGVGGTFLRHADGAAHGGADRLELYELRVSWTDPGSTVLVGPLALPVAAFDSGLCGYWRTDCLAQPGTAVRLDPGRELVASSLRYRNFGDHEAVAGAFTVDVDGTDRAGIRWFELRRAPGGAWSVSQEGTFGPDAGNRFMPGVAMDDAGDMALGFNATDGASVYPSIRSTGRLASDPPGVMTGGEEELTAGLTAQTAGLDPELWGGASMSVDPVDDCTFWFTAAYGTDQAWGTRIAAFAFPGCEGSVADLIFADGFDSGSLSRWSGAGS